MTSDEISSGFGVFWSILDQLYLDWEDFMGEFETLEAANFARTYRAESGCGRMGDEDSYGDVMDSYGD